MLFSICFVYFCAISTLYIIVYLLLYCFVTVMDYALFFRGGKGNTIDNTQNVVSYFVQTDSKAAMLLMKKDNNNRSL